MIQQAIERYRLGADLPRNAILGLGREDLLAFPIPGTWSIQQLVLHLMDSDLVGSDRMKRVIAEDEPTLLAYDETRFAERLFYEKMDAEAACGIFAENRRMTACVLELLAPADFERVGMHTERGRETLLDLVVGYADHLDHHLQFLREKRARLGRPLA